MNAQEKQTKRTQNKRRMVWIATLCALALVTATAPGAVAQCGMPIKAVKPAALHLQFGSARLVQVSYDDQPDGAGSQSIVGMWHVIFTAQTFMGTPIPDMVIDNALAVWHSDHTEIMNSVRPPQDGNFCMGVWEQTGKSKYYLNHFAWFANQFPNGTNNGIGNPTGPTHIREWVTVSPDGNHITGTFQLDAYDTSNNLSASFTGTVSATRITTSTQEQDLVSN